MPPTVANRPDFIGMRFGRLTVIGKAGLTKSKHLEVNCLCDCGRKKVFGWGHLRKGDSKSCGCIASEKFTKDEIGKRYGRLVVVARAGSNARHNAIWKCQCDCGKSVNVLGSLLRYGVTRSCKCLLRETRITNNKQANQAWTRPFGESNRDRIFKSYQLQATKRKLAWSLSLEECLLIFAEPCSYCGLPPGNVAKTAHSHGAFIYSGIDRVDSKLGYEAANVVACCHVCNRMKRDHKLEDFYAQIRRIALNHPEIM